MTVNLSIHPINPQARLIQQAAEIIHSGAVVSFPTDSSYAIGCHLNEKDAAARIRALRRLNDKHHFSLICRDLSELAHYARVSNSVYRLLRAHTPGPYTFILPATNEVPRRLQHPKRKTIGLRIPNHPVVQALLTELNEPLMSVTLQLPDGEFPIADVEELPEVFRKQVDLIIESGNCGVIPTSVIDLTGDAPQVIRTGKGEVQDFLQ